MQLEGTLGQFPLAELIHIIVGSSVTGALAIGDKGAAGQMFCRDGRFYHAHTPTAQGFEAVCSLFALTDAPFQFTASITHSVVTIDMHAESFVEQIELLAQQWSEVRQQIHGIDWIPVARVVADYSPERLSKTARTVFAAVNGQRSASALAERLGLPLLEVGAILGTLATMELVRMEPPPFIVAAPDNARPASLLERMLAKTAAEVVPQRPSARAGLIQRLGFSRH